MKFLDQLVEKWNGFLEKARPFLNKAGAACCAAGRWLKKAWKFLCRIRKVIMAIPVGWGAFYMAIYNQRHLPPLVGLDLQLDGEFSLLVARELAVLGPLAVTALCLLLMFVSRRTLTPWLVSLFSLAIPVLILVTNTFPA